MSKSVKRVRAALAAAEMPDTIIEATAAKTAQMAADAVNCEVDQIAKSIIFAGQDSGRCYLFITAGGNQVDAQKASALVEEPLGKASAEAIRAQTGFAIGGVSPIGHVTPPRAFFDPRLLEFDEIWAAAGTPRHLFKSNSAQLHQISDSEVADFVVK